MEEERGALGWARRAASARARQPVGRAEEEPGHERGERPAQVIELVETEDAHQAMIASGARPDAASIASVAPAESRRTRSARGRARAWRALPQPGERRAHVVGRLLHAPAAEHQPVVDGAHATPAATSRAARTHGLHAARPDHEPAPCTRTPTRRSPRTSAGRGPRAAHTRPARADRPRRARPGRPPRRRVPLERPERVDQRP